MVKVTRFVLAIILVSLAAAPLGWTRAQDEWTPVGNGVDYREWVYLPPEPNHIYVARMDRANPSVTLEAGLANGDISSSRERVSDIAQRYDDSLITWDNAWGNRAHVVAAINGSYVDRDTGQSLSGLVISGWYAKRYDSLGGGSGFAWTRNRVPFVGKCVNTEPDKQIITYASGAFQRIDGVNVPRDGGELVLYTPQYGASTGTAPGGVEVLVRMGSPAGIKPLPSGSPGTIDAVLNGSGSSLIPYDHVVLSASGSAADTLINNAHVGDPILISQEIRHLDWDCNYDPNSQSWTKTYAAVSGAYEFLQAGEIIPFGDDGAINLHPRTAILFNDTYIYFLVVDGRDPDRSIGMTIDQLAHFGKDVLEATWGVAQDGGGSSTMVINGNVMNKPSDPCYNTYLPLVMSDTPPFPGVITEPQVPSAIVCQRPVANSMMMVEVMPPQLSSTYSPSMLVSATEPVDLRLGPGWNQPAYTVISAGTSGSVLDPANGLGGIYAKGTYWWEINFNGQTGWAPEDQLERGPIHKLPKVIVH